MARTVGRICVDCGEITFSPVAGRCERCSPRHAAREKARRAAKQRALGHTTRAWRRLSDAVIARDGRCRRCGRGDDLTAHFIPGGRHTSRLEDYVTLCRSCRGSVDAPRARRARQ